MRSDLGKTAFRLAPDEAALIVDLYTRARTSMAYARPPHGTPLATLRRTKLLGLVDLIEDPRGGLMAALTLEGVAAFAQAKLIAAQTQGSAR